MDGAQKIKVLFLAANPANTDPLRLDEEARLIDIKLHMAQYRDYIDFKTAWAVRPDDLLQKLNEYRPHIVHFSGHGVRDAGIVLNDNDGNPKIVSGGALKQLFATMKVQLVFFNTCYSRAQAEMLIDHVDCVIGVEASLDDEAAIVFASSFYRAIGFGRSVQEAFDQGRASLALEDIVTSEKLQLMCRPEVSPDQLYFIKKVERVEKEEPPILPSDFVQSGEAMLQFPFSSNSQVLCVEYAKTGTAKRKIYTVELADDEVIVGDAYDFQDSGKPCHAFLILGGGQAEFAVLDGAWYRYKGVRDQEQAEALLRARVEYLRQHDFCKYRDIQITAVKSS